MSDANAVKYSSDGRLMLVTTMDGHIHVLDSFRGTLVSFLVDCFFWNNGNHLFVIICLRDCSQCSFVYLKTFLRQLNTFNVKPVSSTSTLDASFSPEGSYVISGNDTFYHVPIWTSTVVVLSHIISNIEHMTLNIVSY